jgi:hypothetical protein
MVVIGMDEDFEALCACPGHAGPGEHYVPCNHATAPDAFLCATCYRGKPLCWNRACTVAESHPHAQQEDCLVARPDEALL